MGLRQMRGLWSVVKCTWMKFKAGKTWSFDKCCEVGLSVVKWREVLRNRVSNHYYKIYRSYKVCCLYGCYVYHIVSYCFGSIFYHCMYCCVFCMQLFNIVNYVFLLLSVYSVSLCCSVYCLCVNVYCTIATGCQPNCS